jgi:hypothetical protein
MFIKTSFSRLKVSITREKIISQADIYHHRTSRRQRKDTTNFHRGPKKLSIQKPKLSVAVTS